MGLKVMPVNTKATLVFSCMVPTAVNERPLPAQTQCHRHVSRAKTKHGNSTRTGEENGGKKGVKNVLGKEWGTGGLTFRNELRENTSKLKVFFCKHHKLLLDSHP